MSPHQISTFRTSHIPHAPPPPLPVPQDLLPVVSADTDGTRPLETPLGVRDPPSLRSAGVRFEVWPPFDVSGFVLRQNVSAPAGGARPRNAPTVRWYCNASRHTDGYNEGLYHEGQGAGLHCDVREELTRDLRRANVSHDREDIVIQFRCGDSCGHRDYGLLVWPYYFAALYRHARARGACVLIIADPGLAGYVCEAVLRALRVCVEQFFGVTPRVVATGLRGQGTHKGLGHGHNTAWRWPAEASTRSTDVGHRGTHSKTAGSSGPPAYTRTRGGLRAVVIWCGNGRLWRNWPRLLRCCFWEPQPPRDMGPTRNPPPPLFWIHLQIPMQIRRSIHLQTPIEMPAQMHRYQCRRPRHCTVPGCIGPNPLQTHEHRYLPGPRREREPPQNEGTIE